MAKWSAVPARPPLTSLSHDRVGPNNSPGSSTSPNPHRCRARLLRVADDSNQGSLGRTARGDRRSRHTPPVLPTGGQRRGRAAPSSLRDGACRALAASQSTGQPSATTTRPRGHRSVDRGCPTPQTSTSRLRRCGRKRSGGERVRPCLPQARRQSLSIRALLVSASPDRYRSPPPAPTTVRPCW